jgi:hypothetical protein
MLHKIATQFKTEYIKVDKFKRSIVGKVIEDTKIVSTRQRERQLAGHNCL